MLRMRLKAASGAETPQMKKGPEGFHRRMSYFQHQQKDQPCTHHEARCMGGTRMKRELGIARCGLACCLCSENVTCHGCNSGECPDQEKCENRRCSLFKNYSHCYACPETCRKGLLQKIKPYAFTEFARRYGEDCLLDCLEKNEQRGIVYHRNGINGDYDEFDDVEKLIHFIKTGSRSML